ncbi:MAG: type II toxin-antitoxin system VapC family toxin [Gammaproteobacteria bacterium]|nr:type II toxin-antitoxin system VapC family toxin [Gammaproteobacteria bacterium]
MIYLLDTCVVSDFIKGDRRTLERIKETSPHSIAVSSITTMEIAYGLALNPEKAKKIQPILSAFLKAVSTLPFENKDGDCSGKIRSFLRRKGMPIRGYDVLLAGTALNRGLILVTSNIREFERIEELQLENWRE